MMIKTGNNHFLSCHKKNCKNFLSRCNNSESLRTKDIGQATKPTSQPASNQANEWCKKEKEQERCIMDHIEGRITLYHMYFLLLLSFFGFYFIFKMIKWKVTTCIACLKGKTKQNKTMRSWRKHMGWQTTVHSMLTTKMTTTKIMMMMIIHGKWNDWRNKIGITRNEEEEKHLWWWWK